MNRDIIVVARHFETSKNLLDVHGASSLDEVTSAGEQQARQLARRVRDLQGLQRVLATPTPQAVVSAQLLAGFADLEYGGTVSLEPVRLGVADGIATEELRDLDREAFASLDRFRARVIEVRQLQLPGGESAAAVEKRLEDWWRDEGEAVCPGSVVVGSNSTVLMMTHLLEDNLPSTGRYRFLATPNGSMRSWKAEAKGQWRATDPLPARSWPDVELGMIETKAGTVAYTRFAPSWDERAHGVLVVPGYFGSSRHGPYGLYSRLARAWAYDGFEAVTIDMLGSGDSSPVDRSFESEVDSVEAGLEFVLSTRHRVVVIAHSMGVATALEARARVRGKDRVAVWSLAPLCSLEDLQRSFFTSRHLDELHEQGSTERHGLGLRLEMIDAAGTAWIKRADEVDLAWLAAADIYTAGQELPVPQHRVRVIENADHNFSNDGNFRDLAASTRHELISLEEVD